ncbi:MAG: carbohydrate-binding domain-containing protein [Firmicutes bacterium]|nr:carbohydrate-binding domain-containing protein [Bacillota bacterium]
MKHKLLTVLLVLMLARATLALAACGEQSSYEGLDVVLDDGAVKVGGEKLPLDKLIAGEVASLEVGKNGAERILITLKNEQHEEVKPYLQDVDNLVLTVVAGGNYRFSGTASDTQIAVDAPGAEVTLLLDGLTLQCATAPAIMVYNAADPQTAGQYGVTICTAEGSSNSIWGSHAAATAQDAVKHDGAISANVSLGFGGSGRLELAGDKEGIEVKFGHLTFDGGEYQITAMDDPIGASEDGVAVITFNNGEVLAFVDALAEEGDGVDSNGYIVVNGGTLIAKSCPHSADSGLDADMGISINGGTVLALGNMYDNISEGSLQPFMALQLAEHSGRLLAVTADEAALLAAEVPAEYGYVVLSSPFISEGEYELYDAESVSGAEYAGLYTEISSFEKGEQLGWSGSFGMKQPVPGAQPEGGEPPVKPDGEAPRKDLFGIGNINGIEITADGVVRIAEEAAEKLIQIFEGLTMTVDRTVDEIMEIDSIEELEDFFNEVTTGLYLPQSWIDANLLPPGMGPQGWLDHGGTNEPVPEPLPPVVVLQDSFSLSAEQNTFANVQPLPEGASDAADTQQPGEGAGDTQPDGPPATQIK